MVRAEKTRKRKDLPKTVEECRNLIYFDIGCFVSFTVGSCNSRLRLGGWCRISSWILLCCGRKDFSLFGVAVVFHHVRFREKNVRYIDRRHSFTFLFIIYRH